MSFKLPETIETRPIAILGAGTLGRRIALMLATRGAEVRLYARSAATRDAGVAALTPTDDPLVPKVNARLMARLIPRSTLNVLDDGHLCLFSKARECAAQIGAFLRADA